MARTALLFVVLAVSAACGAAEDAAPVARTDETGDIEVQNVRSTLVDATGAMAVYMEINNDGPALDRLTAAEIAGCERTELQTTSTDGDQIVMRQIDDGIAIPPLATVVLGPGALAIRCLDMDAEVAEGDMISVMLTFEQAGATTVTAIVTAEG